MKNIIFLLLVVTIGFSYNGSITGLTYFNYQYSEDASGFNLNRQYFNYAIEMAHNIKFKVVFDVGRTNKIVDQFGNQEDSRLAVFLKKAQLNYKSKWGKASFGMIGVNTYGVQEKNWGYRFIEKSAMDKNDFTSTADLGMGFSRQLNDKINFNIQLVNGEGYKKPQSDKYKNLSIRINYGELNLFKNKGFNLGLVFSTKEKQDNYDNLISIYGGVSVNRFRLAGESNFLTVNNITKNLNSLSSTYNINSKIKFFMRYDLLQEENMDDEQYSITGFIYNCGNGFILSPNIRSIDENTENFIYTLNFYFKF